MTWISTQKAINESPEGKFKELELFSLEKKRLGNIKKIYTYSHCSPVQCVLLPHAHTHIHTMGKMFHERIFTTLHEV